MYILNLKCDRCGGKVMEDIELRPPQIVDLHCIHCAKRWWYPKLAYQATIKKLEAKQRERTVTRRAL